MENNITPLCQFDIKYKIMLMVSLKLSLEESAWLDLLYIFTALGSVKPSLYVFNTQCDSLHSLDFLSPWLLHWIINQKYCLLSEPEQENEGVSRQCRLRNLSFWAYVWFLTSHFYWIYYASVMKAYFQMRFCPSIVCLHCLLRWSASES